MSWVVAWIHGDIWGISLLDGSKMINHRFADDLLISMHVDRGLVDGA